MQTDMTKLLALSNVADTPQTFHLTLVLGGDSVEGPKQWKMGVRLGTWKSEELLRVGKSDV
jgi:hypothetical protein